MDFSHLFDLGINSEFARQFETGQVKGKGWLLDVVGEFALLLSECDIEDESVHEGVRFWLRKLDRSYKKEQKIGKQDSKELADDADKWQELIRKELFARPFIEFQEGALNQKALVLTSKGKPSKIFDKEIWKALPKIAQSDFCDAAKCLLVGASTPATMVALRGIEAVIRKYYALTTKKVVRKKNLGELIKELREMPRVNEKLLSYIDYIRSEKRNIAQHPTKVFNKREAERIFMEIVSATHDIHTAMLNSEARNRRKMRKPS